MTTLGNPILAGLGTLALIGAFSERAPVRCSETTQFFVDATVAQWQDTGVTVQQGDLVFVQATGSACAIGGCIGCEPPDGSPTIDPTSQPPTYLCQGRAFMSLCGAVGIPASGAVACPPQTPNGVLLDDGVDIDGMGVSGTSRGFPGMYGPGFVGSDFAAQAPVSGNIYLAVNDDTFNCFSDNCFGFNVTIQTSSGRLEVPVDIKPKSCPNPLNVNSKGLLPVAILGTQEFDVMEIELVSLSLRGVSPISVHLEDVATPDAPFIDKEDCSDCNDLGPDGFLDLTMKFDKQTVVEAIGDVQDGDCVSLILQAELADGTAVAGEDVVIILKKGK